MPVSTINGWDSMAWLQKDMSRARELTWLEYQEKCSKHLQMYEGGYVDLLKRFVKKMIEPEVWVVYDKKYAWNEIDNVMYDVIAKTTKLYNKPSKRAFSIPSEIQTTQTTGQPVEQPAETVSFEDDPVFEDLIDSHLAFDYDRSMDDALRRALVCGGAVVRPFALMNPDGTLNEKIRIQILTPDQFTIRCCSNDKYCITGIEYRVYDYGAGGNEVIVYRYLWDKIGDWIAKATGDKYQEYGVICFVGNEVIEENTMLGQDYPYYDTAGNPKLPFTPIRPYAPHDEIFNQFQGNDLYDATLRVGWLDLQEEWLLRNQSHIQLVLSGPQVDQLGNQRLDATMPIMLPKGDKGDYTITTLDLKTDPSAIQNAKDKVYERCLTRRGYSLEELKMTSQRQSAEAQRIQQRGRDDYGKELASIMRYPEELFAKDIRMVWNKHHAREFGEINSEAEFYIDFGNPYDPDATANWDVKKEWIQLNVISPVDVVLENDHDIKSRDEALVIIERNRNESKKVKSISGVLQSLASNIPPPTSEMVGNAQPPMNESSVVNELQNLGVNK